MDGVTVLRQRIIRSLESQGFKLQRGKLTLPSQSDKEFLRQLHSEAVAHKIHRASSTLRQHELKLLHRLADGSEVDPRKIHPTLVEVASRTEDELLFRYASLHWSIPVSSGYGRRLRFLVVDEQNGKLIGLIGLGDPVFGLKARDDWIGWNASHRRKRLAHVMDAFVLGAVPPYSMLLCGKLVAMLVASNEVRRSFKKKYAGSRSLIRQREFDGRLALVTTTSALGRSSIYNRIRSSGRLVFHHLGYTSGSGDFQFMNAIYDLIKEFADEQGTPTAKHERWGTGFRNRREVVKNCLKEVGLPQDLIYHGVAREVFGVPLARNTREFLRGEDERLFWHDENSAQLFSSFRERWLLPRAQYYSHESWRREQWRIWNQEG